MKTKKIIYSKGDGKLKEDEMKKSKLKTWQYYLQYRHILGDKFLIKLEKKQIRTLYRWSADPSHVEHTQANPLDRLIAVLQKLCEVGREDVAEDTVALIAEAIGRQIVASDEVFPDGDSIEEECLDDLPPLVEFHNAIRGNKDIQEVEKLKRAVERELAETYEKFKQKKEKEERFNK